MGRLLQIGGLVLLCLVPGTVLAAGPAPILESGQDPTVHAGAPEHGTDACGKDSASTNCGFTCVLIVICTPVGGRHNTQRIVVPGRDLEFFGSERFKDGARVNAMQRNLVQ